MAILSAIAKEYLANKLTINKVVYYINKKNELSQHNFAKYSKSRIENKNCRFRQLFHLKIVFISKVEISRSGGSR